jgi:hypothetical protein
MIEFRPSGNEVCTWNAVVLSELSTGHQGATNHAGLTAGRTSEIWEATELNESDDGVRAGGATKRKRATIRSVALHTGQEKLQWFLSI